MNKKGINIDITVVLGALLAIIFMVVMLYFYGDVVYNIIEDKLESVLRWF